jgi:hypothetical protein
MRTELLAKRSLVRVTKAIRSCGCVARVLQAANTSRAKLHVEGGTVLLQYACLCVGRVVPADKHCDMTRAIGAAHQGVTRLQIAVTANRKVFGRTVLEVEGRVRGPELPRHRNETRAVGAISFERPLLTVGHAAIKPAEPSANRRRAFSTYAGKNLCTGKPATDRQSVFRATRFAKSVFGRIRICSSTSGSAKTDNEQRQEALQHDFR